MCGNGFQLSHSFPFPSLFKSNSHSHGNSHSHAHLYCTAHMLSAFAFLPVPISLIPIHIPMPAKHLFPFPLFSHIDIPIPSHSHSRLADINDYNFYLEHLIKIVTALSFISHNTAVSARQIRETTFNTIHRCVTEDRNKSRVTGPLCESRKQEHKV